MRTTGRWVALCAAIAMCAMALAQEVQPASGQKTLAATLNVYVFPSGGQSSGQQSKDESDCYNWAVQNTGSDPFALQKQAQQQQQTTKQEQAEAQSVGQGAGAGGAVRGAAAGTLIGAIAGDAGKGAAYGAAAGLIAGRRRGRFARHEATAQAQQQGQQAQQATAEQVEGFKKAFSVCLEAKKYMVKI